MINKIQRSHVYLLNRHVLTCYSVSPLLTPKLEHKSHCTPLSTMDALQNTISQLSTNFMQRMEQFEGELQKGTSSSFTLTTLAADFASFKTFILGSLHSLQDQLHLITQSVDLLEMRTRKKILLIHGIPEERHEDVESVVMKTINDKLKLDEFQPSDINRCHRMGKTSSGGKPRPILLKLRDISMRNSIWFAKTSLKGTGITLSEFLTKARHSLFMQARKQLGITKCWTRDGAVYTLNPDGTKCRIDTPDMLDNFMQNSSDQHTATQTQVKQSTARTRRMALRK